MGGNLLLLACCLGRFTHVLDDFFGIAQTFLRLTDHLFLQAFALHFLVAYEFSGPGLNFACSVFDRAFGLIFVYGGFPCVEWMD